VANRRTTDEQLAAAVKTWPMSRLVRAISLYQSVLVHPHGWVVKMGHDWPGIEQINRDDLAPMFNAACAELDERIPVERFVHDRRGGEE